MNKYAGVMFRLLSLRFSLLLAGCLLLLSSGAVLARTFPTHPLWSGRAAVNPSGRLENCAVVRLYDDDSALSLALTVDGRFVMALSHSGLTSAAEGRAAPVVTVDRYFSYRLPARVVGDSIVWELTDQAAFQALLAEGEWLGFGGPGGLEYSITGVGESLRAAAACLGRPDAAPPAPAPVAGLMAELDAYAGETAAQEDWLYMKKRFGPLLAGREMTLVPRTRNRDGRVFVTMRITGFASPEDAADFCRAMQGQKRACIVR